MVAAAAAEKARWDNKQNERERVKKKKNEISIKGEE